MAHENTLRRTVARLSSGLRVNSARDDAAGLAIAARLSAIERGDVQALRNANDGVSLAQTADGALGAMADRLQRMRELLLQSGNGALDAAGRGFLDDELRRQRDEFDRVAAGTRFNGRALLDGSFGPALFQIGAGSQDTLSVALDTSSRAADVGAVAIARSTDLRTVGNRDGGFVFDATYTTVPLSQLDFSRPEVAFRGGAARTAGTVATDYASGAAAQFSVDGRTVTLNADYGNLGGVAAAVQSQLGSRYAVSADASGVTIASTVNVAAPQLAAVAGANAAPFGNATGTAGTPASHSTNAGFTVDGHRVSLTSAFADADALATAIQQQLDAGARGRYRVSGGRDGLSIKRLDGLDPPVVGGFTGIGASVFAEAPQGGLTLAAGDFAVRVGGGPAMPVIGTFRTPRELAEAIESQVGGGIAAGVDETSGRLEIDARQTITLSGSAAGPSGALAFDSLVVDPSGSLEDADATAANARARSLLRVDAALDAVLAQRALFGSLSSGFSAIADALQSGHAVAAAARGRITDADVAGETAVLARSQVLQQAAQAMLAQANASARDVLTLLR